MKSGFARLSPRTRATLWLTRGFAAAVLTASSFVGVAAGAGTASAAAPTIDCDTAAQPSADWTTCQKLVGTAKCVWNNRDGTYTLAVGYTNPTADNLYAVVPVASTNTAGPNNAFTATDGFAANPGHAATFVPGTYTTAWTVTWTPANAADVVTWVLMGHTYTWADTYTACPSKPVPVIGNGIVGSMGVIVITGFALFQRRRLRELFRATRWVGSPA